MSEPIDVTRPLGPATRVYPGDPAVRLDLIQDPVRGDGCRVSALTTSLHAGTHVDAPRHVAGGVGGVETLSLRAMIGPAVVVKTTGPAIGPRDVARWRLGRGARVLLRGGSPISREGALELVRRRVALVGTDALSVDPERSAGLPAHRALLSAGIVILENLDLSEASPGRYRLVALPMRIPGADGAPARALLWRARARLSGPARRRPRGRDRSGTRRRG